MATSRSEKKIDKKLFDSFIIHTENIAEKIQEVARRYGISNAQVDFKIMSFQNYKKFGIDSEWKEIDPNDESVFANNDFLSNKNFFIKQTYEVKIFPTQELEELEGFKIQIVGNKNLTKIYASFQKGSVIKYKTGLFELLYRTINHKKVRLNILIGFREKEFIKKLQLFVNKLRVFKTIKLKERKNILIAHGLDVIESKEELLKEYYLEKLDNIDSHGRIDHAKRGFLRPIKKDEAILEYFKAKIGRGGRDCKGEYIPFKKNVSEGKLDYNPSPDITVKETNDSIKYIANKSGYVQTNNKIIPINTDIILNEISFKKTGTVDTKEGLETKIHIKQSNPLVDALGIGMEIESRDVIIEGSLGRSTVVKGKSIIITGQTHKTSDIKGKNIEINTHRGILEGDEIKITRLESGTVQGKNVYIGQAISGTINADNVYIERLESNCIINATSKIEILQMFGSENTFNITPRSSTKSKEILEEFINKENPSKLLLKLNRSFSILEKRHNDIKSTMIPLEKNLLNYKKNSIMSLEFIKNKLTKLKVLEKKLALKKEKLKLEQLSFKTTSLQNTLIKAEIINHGVWTRHNKVNFDLIDPPIKLNFTPINNTKDSVIFLDTRISEDKNEDDEYKILLRKN